MTALGDFSSGDVLTAADMNAIGTWNSYTPTATNFVISSISRSLYVQINELVVWSVAIRVSSGSAGVAALSLPITADGTNTAVGSQGSGMWYDSNVADSFALAPYNPTTTTMSVYTSNSTTPAPLQGSSLGASDELNITFIYKAA